jgi:hypothetical protein
MAESEAGQRARADTPSRRLRRSDPPVAPAAKYAPYRLAGVTVAETLSAGESLLVERSARPAG